MLEGRETVIALVAFILGMLWGLYVLKSFYKIQHKKIVDELHRQYLIILDKHGVKIKNDYKPKGTESMQRV